MEENPIESTSVKEHGIRLADCICPICMSIVLEPVTMPCSHELCRPCFRDTVEQVNFTCPLCRLRISNWARKQAKVNKLVNWKRWKEIQKAFPEEIKKRLEGEDNDDVLQPINPIRISKPGEVREEYEEQVRKHQVERDEQERVEKAKSQKVIREIQEEELRDYEKRCQEEEKLRILDEEFARKLADSEDNDLPVHVVGSLADEQARLDEQLARALQEEQNLQVQTQKDEEFARKLQEELKKGTLLATSKHSVKRLTPGSKKNTKIPATNIERFFKKSRPCSRSEDSSKDDLPAIDGELNETPDVKPPSPDITCSGLQISDIVNEDSNSDSPMFLGPSTSKVIGRADISLAPVEDYNSDLCMEFDENSNSTFKNEPVDDMGESVVAGDCLSLFNECTLLESKDATPSPVAVITVSPPTDVDDDETRSNQEEVVLKKTGAFSPIAKTPPSGIPRKNALRSDSVGSTDSISHELSHFRPIVISPRTAARKLANGKTCSPKLVHSTPTNLLKALEKGESEIIQKSPLLMAKWLSLAQERETNVQIGSKSVMVGQSVLEKNSEKQHQNSSSPCQGLVSVCSSKEDKIITPACSVEKTDTDKLTFDDQKMESSKDQTSDSVKLSPGKVYRMKGKIPSNAKRKNLTKMWSSMCENTDVPSTKCTSNDVKFDRSLLNKIVSQKEDKSRIIEEVKIDDPVKVHQDETPHRNAEIGKKNDVFGNNLLQIDDVGGNHVKDKPNDVHSEEKNTKKMNQTEEKGRRKQKIDIKDCKTIEEMFAKFKKKVGNEDSLEANSIANTNNKVNEGTQFIRSSPVEEKQVSIMNQTLSYKRNGDSGKITSHSETLNMERGCRNKRKWDEPTDGQCKLKITQKPSYSSPKKAQLLNLSSPKKSKMKSLKGERIKRTDKEPLSPGSHRFLKLQTKEEQRLQQEELDRKMALKLQRQINRKMKEEISRVNRSQGSGSEYPLRSRKQHYKTVVANLP